MTKFAFFFFLTFVPSMFKQIVGGPGTAKTTIVQQFLARFEADVHASKTITFSTLTSPSILQTTLENSVEKRQGRSFGPAGGKRATFFLDDLSMPAVNNWGDQITNELVRQVLEQGGFYSTTKPVGELKQLVDVAYVAAMSLPGSGRADIPNRLKRSFCIFHVTPPSKGATMENRRYTFVINLLLQDGHITKAVLLPWLCSFHHGRVRPNHGWPFLLKSLLSRAG